MTKPKLWTKNFISISLSNFFLFSTFYFLLVTLPVYSIQKYSISAAGAGLMTTVFLVSVILSRLYAEIWIESDGFQKPLIAALLIFLFSSLLYFYPKTVTGFFVLPIFNGIGFGIATGAAAAIVSSIIPVSRRDEGMKYFFMSTNLAMVIGPYIGISAIQQSGSNSLYLISSIFALFAFFTGLFIRVPILLQKQVIVSAKRLNKSKSMFEGSAVPISIVGGFLAIIFSSILSFVSMYTNQVHLVNISSLFFVVFAIIFVVSRPFTERWFNRYGANWIIFPSIVLFALGIFVLSQAHDARGLLSSAVLVGLGWGTIFPIFQTMAVQAAPLHRKGAAALTFLSIFDSGIGIGSFAAGLIAAKISFRSFYFDSFIYVLLGLVLFYFLHTRREFLKKKPSPTSIETNISKKSS